MPRVERVPEYFEPALVNVPETVVPNRWNEIRASHGP
jgi:hypothetical protein